MSDEERAATEEKFFADDKLFYEIADTENRLVDLADGANKLSVFDRAGKEIGKYLFTMLKK